MIMMMMAIEFIERSKKVKNSRKQLKKMAGKNNKKRVLEKYCLQFIDTY